MKAATMIALVLLCSCGTNTATDGGMDVNAPILDTGAMDVLGESGDDASDAASDAASSDSPVDSGFFDVTKIPGLVLWLEASQKVTQNNGFVSGWGDLSGNMNDASQATQALRPFLQQAAINGRPGIHFTDQNMGTLLTIADSATLNFHTSDYVIWIVAQFSNPASQNNNGQACFFNKYDANGTAPGPCLFGNANINGNYPGATACASPALALKNANYNDGAPRLYSAQRTGMTLALRVNGNIVATDVKAVGDLDSPGIPVRIGMELGQYRKMIGDIAEIIAAKSSLSMQETSAVDSYLKAKYNL